MERRLHLRVQDIFEKQFNVDFKGYAATEVDEFLDS
ncbi:MAG: DivIVA domain-containing protein, partial [Erysipelotrichaceae bacterium]